MPQARAHLRYLRMSARKVRLLADVIRGMSVQDAEDQLQFSPKRAALPLQKLLKSAIANATNNNKLSREGLFIKSIVVNQGPSLQRYRPRAFGSAAPIRKHSSHITIILEEKGSTKPKRKVSKHNEGTQSAPIETRRVPTLVAPKVKPSTPQGTTKKTPRSYETRTGDTIVPRQGNT